MEKRENLIRQEQMQGETPNPKERFQGFGEKEFVKIWWSILENFYYSPSWKFFTGKEVIARHVAERYKSWLFDKKGEERKEGVFKEWKEYVRELEQGAGKISDIYDPEHIHKAMEPGIYPVIYFAQKVGKDEENDILIVRHWDNSQHFRIYFRRDLNNQHWWNFLFAVDEYRSEVVFLLVFPTKYQLKALYPHWIKNEYMRVYLSLGDEYLLAPYLEFIVENLLLEAEHLALEIVSHLHEED
jgi:hypothetical protein